MAQGLELLIELTSLGLPINHAHGDGLFLPWYRYF